MVGTVKNCIDDCVECASTCLETMSHYFSSGNDVAQSKHIKVLSVCADMCRTAANAMSLGFKEHEKICEVCATVCEYCAKTCEEMNQSEIMNPCIESCRRCAESCKAMSKREDSGASFDFREAI